MKKFVGSMIVLILLLFGLVMFSMLDDFKEKVVGSSVTTMSNSLSTEQINFTGFNQTEVRYAVVDIRYQVQEAWINVSGNVR